MEVERLKRFQGCLVGVAVGDALGMPVEGKLREQIRSEYGVLSEMVDGPRPAGNITDDTMQTLCLAESIAEIGEFNPDDAATRLLKWYRTDPFGIGSHTAQVMMRVDRGVDWRAAVEEVEQANFPWTAGNGSLMRCSPIALRYCRDILSLLEFSRKSSMLTHANPLLAIIFCAAMLCQPKIWHWQTSKGGGRDEDDGSAVNVGLLSGRRGRDGSRLGTAV